MVELIICSIYLDTEIKMLFTKSWFCRSFSLKWYSAPSYYVRQFYGSTAYCPHNFISARHLLRREQLPWIQFSDETECPMPDGGNEKHWFYEGRGYSSGICGRECLVESNFPDILFFLFLSIFVVYGEPVQIKDIVIWYRCKKCYSHRRISGRKEGKTRIRTKEEKLNERKKLRSGKWLHILLTKPRGRNGNVFDRIKIDYGGKRKMRLPP